ncbi:hypothetical protein ccbrp13_01820 [Ktedonobacteria bacterium brp13]|nr:hypothetical protein ccbrp13_01820 [Ktedonobacteria bacterium brp13]
MLIGISKMGNPGDRVAERGFEADEHATLDQEEHRRGSQYTLIIGLIYRMYHYMHF